ncbi:MAG: hypothetical protein SGBAC_004464 [Bacillariaceae sp.]
MVALGERQEMGNRMVALAGHTSHLRQEELEGRQQVQEGIEDQEDDVESRANQSSGGSMNSIVEKIQHNILDSASDDPLQQVLAPFCVVESDMNPNQPGEEEKPSEAAAMSPNMLNLSQSDHSNQRHPTKPNRWRSLEVNSAHETRMPRRASLETDSSRFGRPRQWQNDLSLCKESNVHRIVRDRIQIQELEKKVSSLRNNLHESSARETDLEGQVLSLTNENDLLKEQLMKLQKELQAKSSSSSSKSSNEATETSSTSAESSSQDPLFPDSDSSKKDKEASSAAQDLPAANAQPFEDMSKLDPELGEDVGKETPKETEATSQLHPKLEKSSEPVVAEAVVPHPIVVEKEEPKGDEEHHKHEKQVDWIPPIQPSHAAHHAAHHQAVSPHPHTPSAVRSKSFYIDTCDNSTLSYSLYKGMAEIYDGTVDTGMEGEARAPGTATPNRTKEQDDEGNWEFLTERISL